MVTQKVVDPFLFLNFDLLERQGRAAPRCEKCYGQFWWRRRTKWHSV